MQLRHALVALVVLSGCGGAIAPDPGSSSQSTSGGGGSSSSGGSSGSSGSGSSSGGSSGGTTPTPPNPTTGARVYNIGDAALDAVNVSLDADGTFRFLFDECDARATACGVWTSEKDGFVLRSNPNLDTNMFQFFDGQKLVMATSVSISLNAGPGTVKVSGTTGDGSAFATATWNEGQVCAQCAGEGPSAVVACTTPLAVMCQ